jgi:hypothetical protein
MEKFQITGLMEIIERNVLPVEPFICVLDLPQSSRAFTIVCPGNGRKERTFSAVKIPEVPIRGLLESVLESKEQLLAAEQFALNPEIFVDEMVLRESRCQDASVMADSTYFFSQPWVMDTASDLLKSSEYLKTVGRKVQTQPQVKV